MSADILKSFYIILVIIFTEDIDYNRYGIEERV
jgi:hypothetical protein